jgi:hypothetical protein
MTIQEDMALYGMVAGNAALCSGRRLILHGTIAGDRKVQKGAPAIVRGTVAGRIYNDGGRVELFGMTDVIANASQDAVTIVDYLDLCRQCGIILTSMVALPVACNQRRGTNPIGRARINGLVNPASMRSRRITTPASRRATSQNPPDSAVSFSTQLCSISAPRCPKAPENES